MFDRDPQIEELIEQRVEQFAERDAIEKGNENDEYDDQCHRYDNITVESHRSIAQNSHFQRYYQQAEPQIEYPGLAENKIVGGVTLLTAQESSQA